MGTCWCGRDINAPTDQACRSTLPRAELAASQLQPKSSQSRRFGVHAPQITSYRDMEQAELSVSPLRVHVRMCVSVGTAEHAARRSMRRRGCTVTWTELQTCVHIGCAIIEDAQAHADMYVCTNACRRLNSSESTGHLETHECVPRD